jgi:hypothetical protein
MKACRFAFFTFSLLGDSAWAMRTWDAAWSLEFGD